MNLKAGIVSRAVVTSALWLAAAASAERPAVSEPHLLLGGSFGAIGDGGTDVQVFLADGAYYLPIGQSLGASLEVAAGLGLVEGDAKEAVDGGGRFFWRDPDTGYFGVGASGSSFGSLDRWGAGGFGGAYLGNWDVGGSAGFRGGDGDDSGVFGVEAGWYASEQLRVGAAAFAGTEELYGGDASVAWQPFGPTSNWVFGLDAGGGSADGDGFYSAIVGVLYHFAAPKTLKRQLREDRL
jgi:hypothetical protein